MNRANFKGGAATLTHDGVTYQMHDETWELNVTDEVVDRTTNLQGLIGQGKDYSIGRLTFTPIATSANLSTLWTKLFGFFQPTNIGSLLFPSTDKPAVIQTKSGQTITLAAAAVTRPPEITFGPNLNLLGQVEMTCLIENNSDGTTAGDFVAVSTNSYSEPSLDPLTIISSPYTLAWGETEPFDGIEVDRAGIRFQVTPSWGERGTNNRGLLNYQLDDVQAECRFVPVNLDADDFFEDFLKLDDGPARGGLISSRGLALSVTGAGTGDPTLTIARATPMNGSVRFGRADRIGEVVLRAQRHFSSTLQALYALGTVAAPST